jgi:predicted dienelactone hydrolase
MVGITQATVVALGLFVVALIYHAGQMSQRLTTVERDQDRLYGELRGIKSSIDEVKGIVAAKAKPRDD